MSGDGMSGNGIAGMSGHGISAMSAPIPRIPRASFAAAAATCREA
jgi:hypothetical protein